MLGGCLHMVGVQRLCDLARSMSTHRHEKYPLNHLGGYRIGNQMALILRVFQKAIGRIGTDELPFPRFGFKDCPYLLRKVAAVKAVDDALHHHIQPCCRTFVIIGVITVIHGQKPNSQRWEHPLQVFADLHIIPEKTGQVLAEDEFGAAVTDEADHPLEGGAVPVRSRKSIVHELDRLVAGKLRAGSQILRQQGSLVGNAVTLGLEPNVIIGAGKPDIKAYRHQAVPPSNSLQADSKSAASSPYLY